MNIVGSIQRAAARMKADFDATAAIPHNQLKGTARERIIVREFLQPLLPPRYGLGTGQVVSLDGESSLQQDIVLYDRNNSPVLADFEGVSFFFPETVLAVVEVKSVLDGHELADMRKKCVSVSKLRRSYRPVLSLTPGLVLVGAQGMPVMGIGFAFSSKLTLAGVRDKIREWNSTVTQAEGSELGSALSMVVVLSDSQGKPGLVVHVNPDELQQVMATPTPASRLALVECETQGEALLYMYLVLLEHLGACGLSTPLPNLMDYAHAAGLGGPKLQVATEDLSGTSVTIDGRRYSIDVMRRLQELVVAFFSGQISDDKILELYVLQSWMPEGVVLRDPGCRFWVNGSPLSFATTREVLEAIERRGTTCSTERDEEVVSEYLALARRVIAGDLSLGMSVSPMRDESPPRPTMQT